MQYPYSVMFFALLQCVLVVGSSPGQSLWQQRDPRFAFLFHDQKARRVGDLVTVLISENTDVQNRDERALAKSSDADFNFDFASASGAGGSASANLEIAGDSSRAFDGSSQYRVEQEFTDRITVQVIEVLPNGNLLIGGKRSRLIGDEQRQLEISGVIRPIDIRPDNSIRSQFVANFQVRYSGCGPESHFTNQGWLGRIITRVWPF